MFGETALRIGINPWIGYDVIPMAQRWDWIGPEIELVDNASGADSLAALASGKLHAACLTLDEVIRGIDAGLPLSIVAVMDTSSGADSLLVRPDIADVAQLRGRRIALQASGVGRKPWKSWSAPCCGRRHMSTTTRSMPFIGWPACRTSQSASPRKSCAV